MLKLKRIEIQGFKSFFDRTEMRFNGAGIAAVVGPNGCGKSNLSDAISWVLGEQSAKSLRGARMEDVIFAGTRDRKPLSMASVTMTLLDPSFYLDAAVHIDKANGHANGKNGTSAPTQPVNGQQQKPHEITITRRLFRSGESEYLIDGRQARLRDIQDIFMGTGLGPESYAIIEQGRIGQILSSKPQDRRAVIEEAAGISRFKTKRRLAEAKLEGAKQNLTRVFDILEEVGRQVNSLKRQAAKAKRYEELRADMMAQLRCTLIGRFRTLEREAARTAIELNLAAADFQTLHTDVAAREQEQSRLQGQCFATDQELTDARKHLAELQLEAERIRSRMERQAAQIADFEQRMGQGESESEQLDQRIAGMEKELSAHAEALAELEVRTEEARGKLTAKNDEREKLNSVLRERERQMEGARQQVLRLLGEASMLKNQLAQIDGFLASMDRESARVRREEEDAAADIETLGGLKADLAEKLGDRETELALLSEQRRVTEHDLSTHRNKAVETRRTLEQARGELSRITARKDSLEDVLAHRTYTTESVRRLFTVIEKGQAGDLRPLGVLADFVEVDAAWEKAAEEFLHEELEYVVVKDWDDAAKGLDLLRANFEGRATFLVRPEPDAAAGPGQSSPTGVTAPLRDVLRLTGAMAHASAGLLPRLVQCFLVEDRGTAQRLASEHPSLYFLLPDGACYHGYALTGGRKSGSGPLALKRELRDLRAQIQSRQKEFDDTQALLASLENEISDLNLELERVRSTQEVREKEKVALDHEMRKLSDELTRAESRLSVAQMELKRLENERTRAAEQKQRNQVLVEEKEIERAQQEQILEQGREDLSEFQSQVTRVSEEHSQLRVQVAEIEERRRSERAAQARLEAQHREMAARRRQIATEMERLGAERARLLADNIDLDSKAAALAENIQLGDVAVRELETREQTERTALVDLEEALKQLRVRMQEAQEKRSQIELELVKLQAELKYLDETSRKELNAPLEELAAGEEVVPDDDVLAEAEEKYRELKSRIDALGPVNPQALEEFQEAQQRYDFLNAQRQDLLESIRDTEKAIHEIDVETRKRFTDAFEAINGYFKELFQTLFGGGTGEMRLTDETNASESGIDLVASPPGKKLQNVLLLSGGEKALTAIALLMAIFRYQPSPFCILDEVDAPLDEPNIERLTRLLKEMSAQTQFIVITHAKRTMEAAQSLYGVTMQEPGISKLVSVKFQAQPAPPPPPVETEASPFMTQ
ncbi:MAG TPA: chromosome segregation protein SMC [Bryobacteraceae bacterium]|nr:chromosome segregation protein SMC [Bryobacteraceae bacterium]